MKTESTYNIRPQYDKKFQPTVVRDCIRGILNDFLGDKDYATDNVLSWTQVISNTIRDKIKELGYDDRYKTVVQVVIGEKRGEGVKIGSRCLWDADTDNCTSLVFSNDTMFCVAAVFASYYY